MPLPSSSTFTAEVFRHTSSSVIKEAGSCWPAAAAFSPHSCPHGEMNWLDVFCYPVWAVSTALLAFVVRLQRRGRWDPQTCTVRLNGKTAIVTGANTGIGKFIALDFARRGARVILACRSESRGTAALKDIRDKTGNSDVHLRMVDLSSLDSVREFAKRINEEEKSLHILVNNAAVSGLPRQITKDGLDMSFATNHLGPFLLTNLLLDLIKRSAPSRIVTISSVNHKKGRVDFSHFHGENLTYYMDQVYNHTKLHNIICTNELARRLQGTGVTANSVHPGIVMTEVMRHYPVMIRFLFNLIGFFFFKSPITLITPHLKSEIDARFLKKLKPREKRGPNLRKDIKSCLWQPEQTTVSRCFTAVKK